MFTHGYIYINQETQRLITATQDQTLTTSMMEKTQRIENQHGTALCITNRKNNIPRNFEGVCMNKKNTR